MTDPTPNTEDVRDIVAYAVSTAVVHGYANGKHGEDRSASIEELIDQAVTRLADREQALTAAARVQALRDAAGASAATSSFWASRWLQDLADQIEADAEITATATADECGAR